MLPRLAVNGESRTMYIIPVQGPVVVTSHLAHGNDDYHQGLDIGSHEHSSPKIIAAAAGVVTFVGWDPSGYGNFAILRHNNGEHSLHGHMAERARAGGRPAA